MYKRKQVKENTHFVAKHLMNMCLEIIAPPRNLVHGRYFYSQNKILDQNENMLMILYNVKLHLNLKKSQKSKSIFKIRHL
jgi:hypothetical protein